MKRFILLSTGLVCLLAGACGSRDLAGPGPPSGLMCELLRQPDRALITDPQPEFGWIVNDPRRGARQSAYQLLIASSEARLRQDRGDVWDSGQVLSDQSVNVTYPGNLLRSNTRYWWKVRTWDAGGRPGPYSAPQAFRTGAFEATQRAWPAESRWVRLDDGAWVLENRQRAAYHEIAPEQVVRLAEGHYFADFGKAAFATLQLTLSSPKAGDSVFVYLGERKRDDHTVDTEPGVSNIGYKKAGLQLEQGTHTYTVALPRHLSHYPNSQVLADHMLEVTPYRYAEVVGSPSAVTAAHLRQLALFYYFDDEASRFTSSNDTLNQVWNLCKYTLKATPFLALYADGNRERMPYEADAYIQQLGHYAVDREYAVARYTQQFLLFNPSWPTEWHMHTVFMAWADYMQTGNTESIRHFYDDLSARTLIALAREDGLISTRTGLVTDDFLQRIHYAGTQFQDIVDWPKGTPPGQKQASNQGPTPAGERDGYVFLPINTVVNAFHYRSLVLMAAMAEAVERQEDAAFLRNRAAAVKERFNALLFDRERGIYVDGVGTDHASLHANMFPLAFGLVPEDRMPGVVRHIKSRGMACSVYGAQYLLEALYQAGESQYALDLMTSTARRSWFNMIRTGSTMTTEAWDEYFKPNLTWNHAWGSAPANIIPRKLFGIEPLEPAFRNVQIKPQPGNLRHASLTVPTIRGPVACAWEVKQRRFHLDVTLPANTQALVWLPAESEERIEEGGQRLSERGDIRIAGREDGFVLCEIEAGRYHFSGPMR